MVVSFSTNICAKKRNAQYIYHIFETDIFYTKFLLDTRLQKLSQLVRLETKVVVMHRRKCVLYFYKHYVIKRDGFLLTSLGICIKH